MKSAFLACFILLAFGIARSVAAAEMTVDEWLDALGPLDSETRKAFDKALLKAYDRDCKCVRFMDTLGKNKGRIVVIPLERLMRITDRDRHLLIDGIKSGDRVPMLPSEGS